jgi:hypothetical protein
LPEKILKGMYKFIFGALSEADGCHCAFPEETQRFPEDSYKEICIEFHKNPTFGRGCNAELR